MLCFKKDNSILVENDYWIYEEYEGFTKLSFVLPADKMVYNEEELIETVDGQSYLVKIINGDQITCELNLDELKGRAFKPALDGLNMQAALDHALEETGWTGTVLGSYPLITGENLPERRIIGKGAVGYHEDVGVDLPIMTPLSLIKEIIYLWGDIEHQFTVVFDNKAKTVKIFDPRNYTDSSEQTRAFLLEELNLKRVDAMCDSSDFCTRLIITGKDGVDFSSINEGKNYVENYDYSNKIVYDAISDSKFIAYNESTNPTDLTEAAMHLYAMGMIRIRANPRISYECDVADLAAIDEKYNFLKINLHKIIRLMDARRKRAVDHIVVEYHRFIKDRAKNKIILSTKALSSEEEISAYDEYFNKSGREASFYPPEIGPNA